MDPSTSDNSGNSNDHIILSSDTNKNTPEIKSNGFGEPNSKKRKHACEILNTEAQPLLKEFSKSKSSVVSAPESAPVSAPVPAPVIEGITYTYLEII